MSLPTVSITISSETFDVEAGLVAGSDLINLATLTGNQQLLLDRKDGIDIPVLPTDLIIIDGGEAFSVGDGDPPIEENPCLRKPIHFFFNGKKMTGGDALKLAKLTGSELAALDPDRQDGDGLFADLAGLADEPIKPDSRIIIQDKDRFITTPCGNVGDSPSIPAPLASHFREVTDIYPGATLSYHGSQRLLVVPKVPLPDHWSKPSTDLLVVIPDGYPMAALDMFYVGPEINLNNGKTPGGSDIREVYLDRTWQRFSWHYQKPWNPSRCSLASHLHFCMARLAMAA